MACAKVSIIWMFNCMRVHLWGNMQGKGEQFNNPQNNYFFKEKELPWVGFEPTTLCFPGMSAFILYL